MKITIKGRYALRVMIDLAENKTETKARAGIETEAPVSLRSIAERQDITVKYLEQIVSRLAEAGLIVGTRGNCGGYRLAKEAGNITAYEILLAAERENAEPIADEQNAKADAFWSGFEKAQSDYAKEKTLEDIVKGARTSSSREPSVWIL